MRPKTIRITGLLTLFVAAIAFPFGLQAQTNGSANIAATDVYIAGSSLALEDVNATTGLNIPVTIQTSFGGLKNEQAPVVRKRPLPPIEFGIERLPKPPRPHLHLVTSMRDWARERDGNPRMRMNPAASFWS